MQRTFLIRTATILLFFSGSFSACSPAADSGDGDASGGAVGDGDVSASGGAGSGGLPGASGGDGAGGGASGGESGLGTGGDSGLGTGGDSGIGTGGDGGLGTGGDGGGSVEPCPADAYFCTGFEEAGIPTGSSFHPDYQAAMWENFMTIQGAQVKSGAQALEVDGIEGYMWNVLSTPVASSAFWARFYIRSTVEIGQSEHNSYVAAMTGDGEPNVGDNTEISEQYCQMVLNLHDKVATSIGGSEMCGTGVAPLAADTWHCMEVQFDGPGGIVRVFANGDPVIDVTDWDALDYQSFGFGYIGFHGPARTIWYDDVAVGPTRPGCP